VRAGLLDYYGCPVTDAVRCLSAELRSVASRKTEMCSVDTAVQSANLTQILRFGNVSFITRLVVVVVMTAAAVTTT
jgi:hypothetical protein